MKTPKKKNILAGMCQPKGHFEALRARWVLPATESAMSERAKAALLKAQQRTHAVQAKMPQPQTAVVATPHAFLAFSRLNDILCMRCLG